MKLFPPLLFLSLFACEDKELYCNEDVTQNLLAEDGDCDGTVAAYDCDDAQVGGDSISKITFGRQLKVSADGACGIKVELDKDICPEAGETVTVVKDICCSGSGLGIVYQDLVFTSEGLFSGTANVGSC